MEGELVLPQAMTIADLDPLRQRLLGLLNSRRDLVLDGRAISDIDTAGLQLLAALCRDARERGIAVRWTGVSAELAAGAALLGLAAVLGLDRAPAGAGLDDAPRP